MKLSKKKIIGIVTLAISVLIITGIVVSVVSGKKSSLNSEVKEDTTAVASSEAPNQDTAITASEESKGAVDETTNEVAIESTKKASTTNTQVQDKQSTSEQDKQSTSEQAANNGGNVEAKAKATAEGSPAPKPSLQTVTLKGYIIDEDCYVCYPDPALEDRGCLNMPECAASGYGIAVQENGKRNFYYFDGTISTLKSGARVNNASGGQQIAWNFIDGNIPDKNPAVTVIGVLSGESRTNPDKSTADGIAYSVIKVISIKLS